MRITLFRALLFCLCLVSPACWAAAPDGAQERGLNQDLLPDPPDGTIRVNLKQIATGLFGQVEGINQILPSDMAPFPDGSDRIAILTLGGVVRLLQPNNTLEPIPYLITTNEDTVIEPGNFGIISFVFHPDFADPKAPGYGKFYIIETEDVSAGTPDFDGSLQQSAFGGQHHDVLYEYTTTDPSSDTFVGTKREILRIEQPGWDHNVFDLTFGIGAERGILYITSGDGGNAPAGDALIRENAQFMGNVFGKILRIDPLGSNSANGNYGIPADNPFLSDPNTLDEIYSYGHRAPFRLNTDRNTGDLWLGEVGQNQIEEINKVLPGANYGWALKEGSFLFDELDLSNNQPDPDLDNNGTGDFADSMGFTDPIFEVDHETAVSMTGGFVYRGSAIPNLQGRFIFGDGFGNGLFHANPSDGPVSGETGGVVRFTFGPAGVPMPFGVISIGEDLDGELYLLTLDGRVLRLDPSPCNAADLYPDGSLDFFDVSTFLQLLSNEEPRADFNRDGFYDFFDISAYLTIFMNGC